jgi:hypothetical protein
MSTTSSRNSWAGGGWEANDLLGANEIHDFVLSFTRYRTVAQHHAEGEKMSAAREAGQDEPT